ncbi:MAG: DnaJ domain-containing protein [Candidatus Pacebacteria bacterium]|jgi:hypothetical protein|nr:DnaJ domain-containing protein [Candidatus Paceibacterota bacterium]
MEQWEIRWENYYSILEIPFSATAQDIKDAYAVQTQIYHPDKYTDCSEKVRKKVQKRMEKINRAWEILKDPQKRADYNKEYKSRLKSKSSRTTSQNNTSSTPPDPPNPPPPPTPPPHPILSRTYIDFGTVKAGTLHATDITIENVGGTYTKIEVYYTDYRKHSEWLAVEIVNPSDSKQPFTIKLVAKGKEWETHYSESLTVCLINKNTGQEGMATIRVSLETKPQNWLEKLTIEKALMWLGIIAVGLGLLYWLIRGAFYLLVIVMLIYGITHLDEFM